MSPIILRHGTDPRHVEAIKAEGIKAHAPAGPGGNYPHLESQPCGVYAHPLGNGLWWREFFFEFVYVGPMYRDPYVERAVVIPEDIPPEQVVRAFYRDDDPDLAPYRLPEIKLRASQDHAVIPQVPDEPYAEADLRYA